MQRVFLFGCLCMIVAVRGREKNATRSLATTTTLNQAARAAAGVLVHNNSHLSPHFERTVLLVVCNTGQLDALLNWRCVAEKLGLKFLLVAMDADIAAWFAKHAPKVPLYLQRSPLKGKEATGAFRWGQGEFNDVTMFKLRAVRDVLALGFDVILTDVDVVLFHGFLPALLHASEHTDLAVQQNKCAQADSSWKPGSPVTSADEGNTGFYLMRTNPTTIRFVTTVISTWEHERRFDDQTTLFNVLRQWLKKGNAVLCEYDETRGGTYKRNAVRTCTPGKAGCAMRYCPLPAYIFPSGFVIREETGWHSKYLEILKRENMSPALVHLNCGLKQTLQHKITRMKGGGLWILKSSSDGQCGKSAPVPPGSKAAQAATLTPTLKDHKAADQTARRPEKPCAPSLRSECATI